MLPQGTDVENDAWARRVSHEIAAGSRDALGDLFTQRFDRLVGLVRARVRCDENLALDYVQDAFVRTAESLPPLASLAALDAWLAKAALSSALDRIRAEASRGRRESCMPRPHEHARADLAAELADEVTALDARLDEEQRLLLRLRWTVGMTVRQIARHLGLGEHAAESRIRRAIDAARESRSNR